MKQHIFILIAVLTVLGGPSKSAAQDFVNLTADEVRIDSMLPVYTQQIELGTNFADSIYEVSILYPEFINMSAADIERYHQITSDSLPSLPVVHQYIAIDRKRGMLCLSLIPLVYRDNHYQKLVSFKLSVQAKPAATVLNGARSAAKASSVSSRYAAHSVLASGRWVKISVAQTGIHLLSDELIQAAGFSNPAKVKIYGYGGALQPEKLDGTYLTSTDDLKEVASSYIGGRRMFYAVGPVNFETATVTTRKRNNYSQYGYYFLTESDSNPLIVDENTFVSSCYPAPNDYHAIVEPEEYSWYHGGRNLFQLEPLSTSQATSYTIASPSTSASIAVTITFNGFCTANVSVNGQLIGQLNASESVMGKSFLSSHYALAASKTWTFNVSNLAVGNNTISLQQTSGSGTAIRLDHIILTSATPFGLPNLMGDLPVPSVIGAISNQDLHADTPADLVIVIPTSQKLRSQAEQLAQWHRERDGLRVRVLVADELYNEFSSGTPDANAYRRYLKMLYDRAETEADMPRYLMLMGDGAWDNRMLASEWKSYSPSDFLLCYESENSFSETECYVSDDYFCLLDDGETIEEPTSSTSPYRFKGKPDVATGRISARTAAEAQTMVDKIIGYTRNDYAGAWQNTLCIMADDGNNNQHMKDAEEVVKVVTDQFSAYHIKKVYWDAYQRQTTSTGNSYPEVRRLLKQQMRDGALIMDYSGHGAAYTLSHEQVLLRTDFAEATSMRLPLWITASCDIMPYDTHIENIGETAMFNNKGGSIAFFGTTRTVFVTQNRNMNRAFMKYVLANDKNGKRISIGEAARLAKNYMVEPAESGYGDLTTNKLHYTLLGDPAMVLASPTLTATIDSINHQALADTLCQLSAGSAVTVSGHIEGTANYNGVVTITVRDIEQTVVCKMNNADTSTPMKYQDRLSTIYNGSDSIRNGRFNITFAVPRDISYSSDPGQILIYTINNERTLSSHGNFEGFSMNGDGNTDTDQVGPSIYCYLNSSQFSNGDVVNATPYFYAELSDKDGINVAGGSIGHDLELIIDGNMNRTYNLNSAFQYNFGDYCSGHVGYSLPELAEGEHKLLFRAWDMLNNSSTAELTFTVDPKQEPTLFRVICTHNPASTGTSFIISHDRTESQIDVVLEIFDTSGRKLWEKGETGIPTDQSYTIDWDLCGSSGNKLHPGLYLYRVLVSSNGSSQASKAQKLIIK